MRLSGLALLGTVALSTAAVAAPADLPAISAAVADGHRASAEVQRDK